MNEINPHSVKKHYIISLERRPERWDKITNRIKETVLKNETFERFIGFDGYHFHKEVERFDISYHPIVKNILENNRMLKKGEVGCYLSHVLLLQKIIKDDILDDEYIAIYEDDFCYSTDFDKKYEEFQKIKLDVDFLYTGGRFWSDFTPTQLEDYKKVHSLYGRVHKGDDAMNWDRTTHSYIIKKSVCVKVYELLIKNFIENYRPIDHVYVSLYNDIKMFDYFPHLFWSPWSNIDTDIQNNEKLKMTTVPFIERNVFLYWIGEEFTLISILRNLIYLHSTNGKGYNVKLITDKNINEYVKVLPRHFYDLCPAHKADFVRVHVICEYGGIWLDSDTLVLDSLDSLFDFIENGNGFFIKENNRCLWNGIFGSKPNTQLMNKWKTEITNKLNTTGDINWTEIGNEMLENFYTTNLYDGYKIFDGLDNLYPVNWDVCVNEFIEKSYDNYKNLVREYQPLIVLVNSVYKKLQDKTEKEILYGNLPLNYFINKSFENMKLTDYDFIEIGTSNFDTLIQCADDNTKGISVDAVKYYIDNLPNKLNCKKINVGISNVNSTIYVYYIPEKIIMENSLPEWFKGCNCINNYHPLHIKYNITQFCVIEKVNVITTYELFYQNNVRNVKYLKIDTEGHDCIILKTLFFYIKNLPILFYPSKILFETNEHTNSLDVDEIIQLYCSIGYQLENRGYDTLLTYV